MIQAATTAETNVATAAMILCAGLGTRLRPLTEELPKPLVWLGDRPLLAHIAERLARGGVRRAVLNTHHLAHCFDEEVRRGLPFEATIVHEPRILGTAGGVAGARAALGDGDVVVWNGDILVDVDVAALVRTHAASGAMSTLVVTAAKAGEGTVGLAADGSVVRLRGERFGQEVRAVDFVGVHVVGAALRERLPAEGCLVGDVYMPELRRGGRIATLEIIGGFRDIGTIEAYLEENARWLSDRGERAYVGEGASVAALVDVEGSVVGRGAKVIGEGGLRGVVVWPGATARAPLERAVVLPSGRVARP